jgi:16S rRNA (cytidine1402-2'-O)-methyltransferase
VLVATPIGNLGDLSPRAAEELTQADTIACEDTRRTRALISHLGVGAGNRLLSVHDRNEAARAAEVLSRLEGGQRVVLVTDAGTPALSDPGQRLVVAAATAGHPVTVVPGPSAALAALVVSGLPTDRFCFEGFLPRKGRARSERLEALAAEPRTSVLFESPHRLAATIRELAARLGGDRRVVIGRELTKQFEEIWRGTLAEAVDHADATVAKGEHVIVLAGAPARRAPDETELERALRRLLEQGLDRRSAVAAVAASAGVPRRRVYDLATRL